MTSVEQRWTDRLHLRPVTLEDVPAIAALEADPRADAHGPAGPPTALEGEQLARSYVAQWSGDGLGYWAVELRGRLIGVAGLRFNVFQLRDCWELYFRFTPDVWRRGYAAEVAIEAVALAIDRVPRLPVLARTRPDDVAAQRVAEAAGLERRPDLDADGLQAFVTHW